jgi:glycosyltransferase involved in cell wall biosynthesis
VTGAATGYALAGADTTLFVPRGDGDVRAALSRLAVPDPAPFRLALLPRPEISLGVGRLHWGGRFRRAVRGAIDAGSFDVAVVRDLRLAWRLLQGPRSTRLVYEMHNIYSFGDDAEAARLFSPDKLRAHQARVEFEREVLARADGVIVLTEGLRRILIDREMAPGRIGVGGSALHPWPPSPKSEHRTDIAYIGSLDPHKGVGLLVRALTQLPSEVRLRLIGHGRHHEPLLRRAEELGVAARLVLAGWFAPAELPSALAECFAAAVPLEDCFYNRHVTSPMKLFDYVRAGVVPVVPRMPVFEELFGEHGGALFVPAGDASGFGRALQSLYEEAALRQSLEARLAAFAATHTWQKRGEPLLSFFATLA